MARMNKLVWDVMSPQGRSLGKKMQQIATQAVKAGVHLTNTMSMLVDVDKDSFNEDRKKEILDGCNDALALMGHANYKVNITRRDLLRPELKRILAFMHSLTPCD